VIMIRLNMGNNEYDVEPFNNKLGPTIKPHKVCALKFFNKYILAIQTFIFLALFFKLS
jgi:hypothetical protein